MKALTYNGKTFPLRTALEHLQNLSLASAKLSLRLLLWTNEKGFYEEKNRFGKQEIEEGYYAREEDFLNEITEKGNRWQFERATNTEQLAQLLSENIFDAVIILGAVPAQIVRKAVHYCQVEPRGPKTLLLEFEKRAWAKTDSSSIWEYLNKNGRLHLMNNFVHLVERKSQLKFLPAPIERLEDSSLLFWEHPIDRVSSEHIERLFSERTEEQLCIDYKRAAALADKKELTQLMERICSMANARGGYIIVGIVEEDGVPKTPIKEGLEEVSKPDEAINRLTQKLTANDGQHAPEVEYRTLLVRGKRLVLIHVVEAVLKRCGLKVILGKGEQIPVRTARITSWMAPGK